MCPFESVLSMQLQLPVFWIIIVPALHISVFFHSYSQYNPVKLSFILMHTLEQCSSPATDFTLELP